ncbi:MAG: hypothetical protein CM15mP59_3360 [Flavobacteriaceae bacterium]|nr:MAG: hypothetical protein CM15mP59_3360 [Flavobacteriaceae bacterium]
METSLQYKPLTKEQQLSSSIKISPTTDDRIVRVDDSLKSLQELATAHRTALGTTILALTGSNGKTTTKELIYAVLKEDLNTVATKGNLNNHIGVP